MKNLAFLILLLCCYSSSAQTQNSTLPNGFVELKKEIPSLLIDLRYYGTDNFVGKRIAGYLAPKAILSKKATLALADVQRDLKKQNLGLKVFDAYRPQRAVNHFIAWAKVHQDTLMKAQYYPYIDKKDLFKKGYIASRSGHSRGSTIDLTIINLDNNEELDMGSNFDYFGDKSHHNYAALTTTQKKNRALLKKLMEKHGFRSYSEEWWHYTLNNEPFKGKYFDFVVN